ncbi:TPA: MFS transporter [Enterobacter cancerogenus]|uniref:MFS transporter n=1 Tax=Enterobacter cancerogenus TaxID=69218 RepID=UPI00129A07E2|nr:MFS transporter [Enterobacter cancerogenus]MRG34237.1 MFS transporter [Enterobacter cancerogenus]QZY39560.1 MFS transporter [Enterobacter cancerogenus]
MKKASIFFCLVLCVMASIAGTDLVLPAIPLLKSFFHTTPEVTQRVLSAYVGGNACGLLLFGRLSDYFSKRKLLCSALLIFSLASLGCAYAPCISVLVAIRFVQGLASAAAPVFVPGFIRELFDEHRTARAIGLLGSLQALVPAAAPLAGVILLAVFDWSISFKLLAILTAAAAGMVMILALPESSHCRRAAGNYRGLLRNLPFLRYALSHALTVGGMVTFVFGAPTVITLTMHGTLKDFIIMQVANIGGYIVAANLSAGLAERYGADNVIKAGTCLALSSAIALTGYGMLNGTNTYTLAALFAPMGIAVGLRGPIGFYQGIVISGDNNARGAALIAFFTFTMMTLGSLVSAEFIVHGLMVLAAFVMAMHLLSLLLFMTLPRP